MDRTSQQRGSWRIPYATLFVVALVLLLHRLPGTAPALAYDRAAIAAGEGWRMVTGHFVHASRDLLFWDVATFVVLGWLCESRVPRRFAVCLAASVVVIPAVLWLSRPDLHFYGGLSGVDSAIFALLAVVLVRERMAAGDRFGTVAVSLAAAAFGAKIAYECATGSGVFVDTVASNLHPAPMAHVVGAVVGVMVGAAPVAGVAHGPVQTDADEHSEPGGDALRRRGRRGSWPIGCYLSKKKERAEMRARFCCVLSVCCLVCVVAAACAVQDPEPIVTPEVSARLEKAKENIDTLSLVIHPVLVAGRPMQNVAEVLAVMFEQAGLNEIDVAGTPFVPETEVDLAQFAAGYGSFVVEQGADADYALLGEFFGTPGKGVDEIRLVVVDKQGQLVWADSQTPEDADFRRIQPRNPMTCCVLLAERLRGALDLPEADPDSEAAGEGRWARHWRDASGVPADDEIAAMDDRKARAKGELAQATVAVFPVLLLDGVTAEGGAALARELADRKLCRAEAVAEARTIEINPNPNEQRRLWDLARGFRDSLRADPVDADYALIAEYVLKGENGPAHTVHWVLCEADGDWVIVDFQNDHHPDFQKIDPHGLDTCNELVVTRLTRLLAR